MVLPIRIGMKVLFKHFILEASFLGLLLFVDQYTKSWALGLSEEGSLGLFSLLPQFNRGFILGSFSELPEVIRLVTLSGAGALLLCLYIFFRCFGNAEALRLRGGFILAMAGILGNWIDRVSLRGSVVDFLSLKHFEFAVFNIADIYLFVGVLVCVLVQLRLTRSWHADEKRLLRWPRGLQLKMTLTLTGFGLVSGIVYLAVGYSFLRVALPPEAKSLSHYLVACALIQVAQGLILFCLGTYLSEKVSGPLFAIERQLKRLAAGHRNSFRLRDGDYLREFEAPLDDLRNLLDEKASEDDAA